MGGTIAVHTDARATRSGARRDRRKLHPVSGRRGDPRAQGAGGASSRRGARSRGLRPPRPSGHAARHARARRGEPRRRGARPRASRRRSSTPCSPTSTATTRCSSTRSRSRPVRPLASPCVACSPTRRPRAPSGHRPRSTGSCRTGTSTSPRRSSGRSPPSPTTRRSAASIRIRAASGRSERPRSSTARARGFELAEPFVLVRSLESP